MVHECVHVFDVVVHARDDGAGALTLWTFNGFKRAMALVIVVVEVAGGDAVA